MIHRRRGGTSIVWGRDEYRAPSYLANTQHALDERTLDEEWGPPNPHRGEDFSASFARARALACGTRKP